MADILEANERKTIKAAAYGAVTLVWVLPALSEAVGILQAKAPEEADNYRRMVKLAVEEASTGKPAEAEMIRKIDEALHA
jgi:hypothetical protein